MSLFKTNPSTLKQPQFLISPNVATTKLQDAGNTAYKLASFPAKLVAATLRNSARLAADAYMTIKSRNSYVANVLLVMGCALAGDYIGRTAIGAPMNDRLTLGLIGLSFYYGWEGGKVYDLLHSDISISKENELMANDPQLQMLTRPQKFIYSIKNRTMLLRRVAVKQGISAPLNTIRHLAIMAMLMHEPLSTDKEIMYSLLQSRPPTFDLEVGRIFHTAAKVWLLSLPAYVAVEWNLQDDKKVPQEYRFLIKNGLNTAWQILASAATLLG